jgi:imidazolonepropionase-like amidohydrolase
MKLLLCLWALQAAAAEPAKPAGEILALVGGDVETVSRGFLKGATVLIKDGKIERVGAGIEIPEGAKRIDVKGKRVLPGFVAAQARGLGGPGAAGKVSDAFDPFHDTVMMALAGGVTTAYLEAGRGSGFFGGDAPPAGSSAVVKMTYGSLDGMLLLEPGSVAVGSWVRGGARERHEIREQFRKAREHLEKERDYERRRAAKLLKPDEAPPKAAGLQEAQVQLLKGERVARMEAESAEEILKAVELAEEFRFRLVLTGVVEGWTVADRMGRAGVEAVFAVRRKAHAPPGSDGRAGSSIEQAAVLRRSGVRFAIVPPTVSVGTGGIPGKDLLNLPFEAAFAIRGGLDPEGALRSVTLDAARLLGVDHRVGSIEEGKDADLVVLDGDPFDYRTWVDLTFVNGRLLYDRSASPWFSHHQSRR